MGTIIKNNSLSPGTLPLPLAGIIDGNGQVPINATPAAVIAALGGAAVIPKCLQILDAPFSSSDPTYFTGILNDTAGKLAVLNADKTIGAAASAGATGAAEEPKAQQEPKAQPVHQVSK